MQRLSEIYQPSVQRVVLASFLTHRQVRTNREVQQIEKCNFASLHPAAFLPLKTSMFIQRQKIAFAHFACLHCCVSLHRGSLLGKPPFLGIFCWEWCPIHTKQCCAPRPDGTNPTFGPNANVVWPPGMHYPLERLEGPDKNMRAVGARHRFLQ